MRDDEKASLLGIIMGFTLGIAITYTTVAVCFLTYSSLAQYIGDIGAITVDVLVGLNVYTALLGGGR